MDKIFILEQVIDYQIANDIISDLSFGKDTYTKEYNKNMDNQLLSIIYSILPSVEVFYGVSFNKIGKVYFERFKEGFKKSTIRTGSEILVDKTRWQRYSDCSYHIYLCLSDRSETYGGGLTFPSYRSKLSLDVGDIIVIPCTRDYAYKIDDVGLGHFTLASIELFI